MVTGAFQCDVFAVSNLFISQLKGFVVIFMELISSIMNMADVY